MYSEKAENEATSLFRVMSVMLMIMIIISCEPTLCQPPLLLPMVGKVLHMGP